MPFIKGHRPPKKGEKMTSGEEVKLPPTEVVDPGKEAWFILHRQIQATMSGGMRHALIRTNDPFYHDGLARGWANEPH